MKRLEIIFLNWHYMNKFDTQSFLSCHFSSSLSFISYLFLYFPTLQHLHILLHALYSLSLKVQVA